MKRQFAVLLVAIGLFGVTGNGWSNSASPFPVTVEQPGGQNITLYLRGTEKLHWYEFVPEAAGLTPQAFRDPRQRRIAATPGYTVVKDAEGRYVYANVNDAGEWAPTDQVVGVAEPPAVQRRLMPPPVVRTRMAVSRLPETGLPPRVAAPSGDVRNLVILMRFADHTDRSLPPREQFETLFNSVGGDPTIAPTGSVQDFYRENSYGKLQLRSTIVDWITLPKTEAYYANKKSGLDARVREAMVDALNLVAQRRLVDFKEFDNEGGGAGDGWIDAITFVHSGYAAEFGGVAGGADVEDRIWSHRWVINTWTDPASGVRVRDYNINPGLWGTSGNNIGRIGVICHELGHFFGLPDLYDYSGLGEGIGSWCLMANSWGFNGSQLNPPHMSAWCKISLGWNNAEVITQEKTYTVPATALPEAKIYRVNYASGSPDEYILIENRHPIGNFDGGIPTGAGGSGGLLIWHIDDAKTENDTPGYPGQPGWPGNGNHYWVALLQADGQYNLEKGDNRGDADDPFRKGHVDLISPTTTPSSNSYAGVEGPIIKSISTSMSAVSFQLGNGTTQPETSTGVFTGNVNVEVPTSHVATFTEDRKVGTLLFDRLYSSIFGTDHAREAVATFILPVKDGDARLHVDLRGYVSADDGTTATLVVQINGQAYLVDLMAAQEQSATPKALSEASRTRITEFETASGFTEGFNWFKRFEAQVAKDAALTVTAVLMTEKHLKDAAGALLVIDSLDVAIDSADLEIAASSAAPARSSAPDARTPAADLNRRISNDVPSNSRSSGIPTRRPLRLRPRR